jgi:hypothetical protein
MRSVIISIFLAAGLAMAQQQPAKPLAPAMDTSKRAAIEELLSLMKMDQMQKQMLTQYQQLISEQIEKVAPLEMQNSPDRAKVAADIQDFENRLVELMKDRIDFVKMKPEYVRLYDETFSSEEVAGIVAFYKTPAGQAYVAKLPVLTAKSVEMSQQMLTEVMPQLLKMNEEWVGEMKRKYSDPGAK